MQCTYAWRVKTWFNYRCCFHAGTPLDREKNVRDYDFQPHDRIIFVQQTLGGSSAGFRAPPGVELELTQEPCCALLDDDPNDSRARMPCGCAISKFDAGFNTCVVFCKLKKT